jgi:Rhodopirellula transposase DDE domain
VELPWKGTKLVDVKPRLEWAKSLTGKGLPPIGELRRKGYHKGIALSKKAMQAIESRWERHPELPKGDMLIRPASVL